MIRYVLPMLGLVILMQCQPKAHKMENSLLDIQGHRGARGLLPENTVPAFIKALELGVTTLELDLAVTKDHELLVSHEPYMAAHLAIDPEGHEILKENELQHNIYAMTYEQIKKYDVGSKVLEKFPEQKKMKVYKPLLKELVQVVDEYIEKNQKTPARYNIEIKSRPMGDSIYHPTPSVYAQLVYDFISTQMDTTRLNVQSFDFRVLQYFHENYPEIKLAALVENDLSIAENLKNLGFIPDIYSCYYQLLDSSKVASLQQQGMQVIPWTVNEKEEIKKVVNWGIDGIISDYPDRVLEVISY